MKTAILLIAGCLNLLATNRSWTGLGADAKWSTNGNWNPSGAIGSGDSLTFDSSCTNCNSTVDTDVSITNLTVASSYTGTLTSTHTITIGNQVTLSGGTLVWTGGTLTFGGGGVDITCAGNLKSTSGVTTINDSVSGALTVHSSCALDLDSVSVGSSITVNSGATVNAPANPSLASLDNAGTFNGNTSLTIINRLANTGTLNLSGEPLTITSSNVLISCTGNLKTISGLSTVSVNLIDTLTVGSGCTVNVDTYTNGSLTVQSSAVVTLPATASMISLNNAGTVTSSSGTLSVSGNWTNTGTFNANGGIVSFTDLSHTLAGSTTFNDFSMVTTAAARIMTFTAGTTQTISGTLTLTGSSGKLLTLASSASPAIWTISPTGARAVSWVNVTDSTNSAVSPIYAGTHSVNGGNNVNWIFTDSPAIIGRHGGFIGD